MWPDQELSDSLNNWTPPDTQLDHWQDSLSLDDSSKYVDITFEYINYWNDYVPDPLGNGLIGVYKFDLSDSLNNWNDAVNRVSQNPAVLLTKAVADTINVRAKGKDAWRDGIFAQAIPLFELDYKIDDLGANLDDSVAVSVSVFFNSSSTQVYDSLSYFLNDAVAARAVVEKVIGNALNLSDSIALDLKRVYNLGDTLILEDSVGKRLGIFLGISDTLTLTDAAGTNWVIRLEASISDTLSLSDSASSISGTSFLSYIRNYLNDRVD